MSQQSQPPYSGSAFYPGGYPDQPPPPIPEPGGYPLPSSPDVIDIDAQTGVGEHAMQPVVVAARIGGAVYTFRITKRYGITSAMARLAASGGDAQRVDMAAFGEMERWLFSLLSPEQAAQLQAALDDPESPVDVQHVTSVFRQIMERVGDRPT